MTGVVVQALSMGMPIKQVAGLVGATYQTLQRWRERGCDEHEKDDLYVDFAVRVEEARAKAAEEGVRNLSEHANVDWKARLELLRAQDPEVWSKQSTVKVDATLTPAKPRNLGALTEAELDQLEYLENKTMAAPAMRSILTSGVSVP